MQCITKNYYRQAMGVFMVYDVTDQNSYNDVEQWLRKIDESAKQDLLKVLVANKIDKKDKPRVIPTQMGLNLAERMGMVYIEASAYCGWGLNKMFYDMTCKLVDQNIQKQLQIQEK